MATNKTTDKDPLAGKVDADSAQHIRYWTLKLGCTAEELRDAVASVGSDPDRVAEYIHLVRGERDE